MNQRQHIEQLLKAISVGLYEKDHILALALLCAISGESYFLLGPPGTAKSEVARRLKLIFKDATAFEYLMSRFSTPDEIFGPVSIQKLKAEDTYCRKVEGFLPSATIVFLDEIWKAGPAIQNALLTVINEHIYQNGTDTLHVPMKCLIAASNELPAENEGLEALWDRFLVRVVSNCISDERTFYNMLRRKRSEPVSIPTELQLTQSLYEQWQQGIDNIDIPDEILNAISYIRKELSNKCKEEDVEPLDYYISDRRWCKIVHLMQASAFLNGRKAINYSELLLLINILWNKVDCIDPIIGMVVHSIFNDIEEKATKLETRINAKSRSKAILPAVATNNFKKYSYFYLKLVDYPEPCYLYELDYKRLTAIAYTNAIVYYDMKMQAKVIRRFEQKDNIRDLIDVKRIKIKLAKSNELCVEDKVYEIETIEGEKRVRVPSSTENRWLAELSTIADELNLRCDILEENMFLSDDDIRLAVKIEQRIIRNIDSLSAKVENLSYDS